MTDALFSLSFSLNWRKEKSILEFERNSPPTRKRETHTITSHERARKLWEKKADLKRVPFSLSLFFSLFQRRRERMNRRQQQQQQRLLCKSMGERDSFSSFFSLIFLLFLRRVLGTPNNNNACVFVRLCRVCSFVFFLRHKKKHQ